MLRRCSGKMQLLAYEAVVVQLNDIVACYEVGLIDYFQRKTFSQKKLNHGKVLQIVCMLIITENYL
jgi:hypothetical protein